MTGFEVDAGSVARYHLQMLEHLELVDSPETKRNKGAWLVHPKKDCGGDSRGNASSYTYFLYRSPRFVRDIMLWKRRRKVSDVMGMLSCSLKSISNLETTMEAIRDRSLRVHWHWEMVMRWDGSGIMSGGQISLLAMWKEAMEMQAMYLGCTCSGGN